MHFQLDNIATVFLATDGCQYPRPDGTFAEGEAKVARAMGAWLREYGEAIYATRGGPYRNGTWGGTCHKGNKLYLLVYEWSAEGLGFDPLPNKVLAARTLTGAPVTITQSADEFTVEVAQRDRDKPVTVIELTLDKPVADGLLIGAARAPKSYVSEHGSVLSDKATLELSSRSGYDDEKVHARLFSGDTEDGQQWQEVWRAKTFEPIWTVAVTHMDAGAKVPGGRARFIRLETNNDSPRELLLKRVTVFGVK